MANIMIDYRSVIERNKLSQLVAKVGNPPNTSLDIGLVIVIPKTVLEQLDDRRRGAERIQFINSSYFVNAIEGYTYLVYDSSKHIAQIVETSKNMVSHVVSATLSYLPEDTILTVAVGLDKRDWEPYVRYGFRNPVLSSKTPLLGSVDKEMLILSRCNAVVEEPDAEPAIKYLVSQSNSPTGCSVIYRLTGKAHRYLKSLASVGSTLNGDGSISQKEVSGTLHVLRVERGGVHVLEVDNLSVAKGGEEEAVPPKGLYTFHSHPREAYERNGVSVAWPSCQDFYSFLSMSVVNNAVAHLVATIEGLYTISLSEYWARSKSELPLGVIDFIRNSYDLERTKERTPDWFVRETTNIKFQEHPLFVVGFSEWSKNPRHRAYFSSVHSNCLSTQGSVDAAKLV